MTNEFEKIIGKFHDKFKYFPEFPDDVITDSLICKEFCEVLEDCIETGIDKTIEKYGTEPPTSFEFPDIFIDYYDY
ncbi:MAG: hypothetical protein K2I80_11680 [Ruminococcus sp.]|nr:hypothetical protein [Ruminococcus sp.]